MFTYPRCSISFNDMFTRFATEQFLKISLQTGDVIFAFCAFSLVITLSIAIIALKLDLEEAIQKPLETVKPKVKTVKAKKVAVQQPLRRSARIQAQTLRRSARIQAQKLISL